MIFKGVDGILLYGESHLTDNSRGSLLVVHGLGEHLGRYSHLVKWANKLGLDVHLMDLRGHGRSQGIRGHTSEFSLFAADLENFVEHLNLQGDKPCFLFGHSMGGLVSLDFVLRNPKQIDGLILSSPAVGIRLGAAASMQVLIADSLPGFLCALQFPNGITSEMLTHDPKEIEKHKNDPLNHHWITPALFTGLVKTIESLGDRLKNIDVPVLFLIAGRDTVVDGSAAERFAAKLAAARPKLVRIRRFHSFYHEVINETRKELAFQEMKLWIQNRLRGKKKTDSKKSSSASSKRKATAKATSR
jgi:lysophospholipase